MAKNGFLDLSEWDFKTDGPVDLRGEWKFKWMEDKEGFSRPDYNDSDWDTMKVPGYWNDKVGTSKGFGWLRLKIMTKSTKNLVLSLTRSYTAYTMYVNGNILIQNGVIGIKRKNTIPQELPSSHALPVDESLFIAWKISNYHYINGGPQNAPKIGMTKQIQSYLWKNDLQNGIIIGIIFMMFLYHLLLWFGRREDKASIYFSLLCFIIIVRIIATNFFIERLFPIVSITVFEIHYKLALISLPVVSYLLPTFFHELYPAEFNRKLLIIFQYVSFLFSLFIIVTPSWIFSEFLPFLEIILIVVSLWILVSIIISLKNKRQGAGIVFLGFIILFITLAHDVISHNYGIGTPYMVHIGLLFLIFAQSTVLSLRFARAFRTAEHLSKHLQKEVNKKTSELQNQKKELQTANTKLKEMDHHKTLFFQNITHEFRTPLTLIIGPLESILTLKKGTIPDRITEQLAMILRNARSVLHLINQLLELSKFDAHKMELHPQQTDLVELLCSITASFESLARKKEIQFRFEINQENIPAYIDTEKIEKVIYNLLSNAFKFTEDKGEIVVSLSPPGDSEHPRPGEAVEIRVKDTGIGIPEKELPFIFDRFRQVDGSSTREWGGTGIGLSLAKEYVELHHGKILVKSKAGEGTEFIILLPLKWKDPGNKKVMKTNTNNKRETSGETGGMYTSSIGAFLRKESPHYLETQQPESNEKAYGIKEKNSPVPGEKVLIVEDNSDMRQYIKSILKNHIQLFEAENGEEGLRKAREIKPDLIISDIMMPKMDGNQLIKILKTDKKTTAIPVIVLTAKASEDLRIEGLAAGADDYITKPFNPKELIARVQNLLKIKRQNKELEAFNKKLIESERMKNLLSGTVIHDIKNYAATIAGSIQFMKKKYGDDPRTSRIVKALKTSCDDIANLSSNLLDIGKMEEGRMEIHKENYGFEQIQNIVMKFTKNLVYEEKDIKVEIRPPGNGFNIKVDPYLLERVIQNLFSNATKYTYRSGRIEMGFETDNGENIIYLFNSGDPIHDEQKNILFNKYIILGQKRSQYSKGLGLFFCKMVMEAHGGRIWVESHTEGNYFKCGFRN